MLKRLEPVINLWICELRMFTLAFYLFKLSNRTQESIQKMGSKEIVLGVLR